MDTEHRDAIRESNRRRGRCPRCGNELAALDGSDTRINGLPGIRYKHCHSCGHTSAAPVRKRK